MKKAAGKKSSKNREARPLFDAMRKPVAPPGHTLGQAKPEARVHPAQRKVKHKRNPVTGEE